MDKLKKLISQYDVISFDIFDTLIYRTVANPTDLFDLIEQKYNALYGENNSIRNFKTKRIRAEQTSRINKNSEITLEDIYELLAEEDGNTEKYKNIESQMEVNVSIKNPRMYEIYMECVRQGKRILIISDMYLDKSIIKKILSINGYEFYHKLYLSSEIGYTKASGELYTYCLKNENIPANHLLHIGDNLKSDIIQAHMKGIATYHVKIKEDKIVKKGMLDKHNSFDPLYFFVKKTMPAYGNVLEEFGYGCFGPLLYGFIDWILNECKVNHLTKIFFMSRDGYIMKRLFDTLKKDCPIKSEYMFASRRAFQGAVICINPEFESVINGMFHPRMVSVKWLVERWGLEIGKCRNQLKEAGIKETEEIQCNKIVTEKRLKKLFELLKPDIISNSLEEYRAFVSYLDEIGFRGNVAIVDIGWYGNMQNCLETIIKHAGIPANINGYYLGLVPESKHQECYSMKGYLFGKKNNENLFYRFKFINSLMEIFFMAPHGSVRKYVSNKKSGNVELSPFEYQNTYTQKAAALIQDAAFDFTINYPKMVGSNSVNDPIMYLDPLFSSLMRPSLKLADALGELVIWDSGWIKIAPKENVITCLVNPIKTTTIFLNAPWKMGYLKRLIILPLKYEKIVLFLRDIYKGKKS